MRIGVISTYPPIECGIATYTKYLTDALLRIEGNEIYIVSQFGGAGEKVYPAFHGDDADLAEKVFKMMIKFTPDIVHIQHEFGIFGPSCGVSCIPLVYKLRLAGVPVVITFHTIYEEFSREQKIVLEALIRACDAVIVHEEYQEKVIIEKVGSFDNIWVIPHGAREIATVPEAKRRIGIDENARSILLCGYFRPTKGMDRIVRIFPKIAEKVENAVLVIAGKMRSQDYKDYRDMFFRLVETSPARDRIFVLRGQFPQKTFDTIMSSGDVVPMPYLKGAQSGVLAHCLAFGRPVVVSPDVRSLRETVTNVGCGMVAEDDEQFVNNITKILKNSDLWLELSNNAVDYVKEKISWRLIAKRTMDVYRSAVKIPHGHAMYINL